MFQSLILTNSLTASLCQPTSHLHLRRSGQARSSLRPPPPGRHARPTLGIISIHGGSRGLDHCDDTLRVLLLRLEWLEQLHRVTNVHCDWVFPDELKHCHRLLLCSAADLHPLECADESEAEAERDHPAWTGSFVSNNGLRANDCSTVLTFRPHQKINSASAATIVKLVIIIELQTASGAEAKALHYDLLLWADIELGMALFAASAAALRPILGRLPSMWGSYFSKGSGYLSKGVKGTRHTSTNGSHGLDGVVGPYREVVGQSSREDIELGHVVGQRHHAGDGEIVKTTTVTVETGRDGGSGRAVSPSLAYIPSRDTFI